MRGKVIGFIVVFGISILPLAAVPLITDSLAGSQTYLIQILLCFIMGILFAIIAARKQVLSYLAASIGGALVCIVSMIVARLIHIVFLVLIVNFAQSIAPAGSGPYSPFQLSDGMPSFYTYIQSSLLPILAGGMVGAGGAALIVLAKKSRANKLSASTGS